MCTPSTRITLGLIIGNRGFFPDHLAQSGRDDMLGVLAGAGVDVVAVSPEETKYGAVETREEAKRCAALFKARRDDIAGIIVSLPNFGEERGIVDAIRLSGLDVPVLVQATPDVPGRMTIHDRRDSFCGKMSACSNLSQYGIRYSLTSLHTERPDSAAFARDLQWFLGVCRVVRGLRRLRVGAIGARPAAFNTVRYSEKLLEASGISVETVDLSEILGRVDRMKVGELALTAKLQAMSSYVAVGGVPMPALTKMAKLGVVVDQWMAETDVDITAVQCWTAIEDFFGVVPCTVMSMLSDQLKSSACEVDVCGAVAMHALRLASGTPSALLDWNNNYGDDPDKAVCFHCSNLPKHFFVDVRMDYQEIIAGTVGRDNTWGTCVGRVKAGPVSFARFSTDDRAGKIRGYVGEGRFTDDALETFGGAGVVHIPGLQHLLRFICENAFEHHVAANLSSVADMVHEATTKYLGWEMYKHSA
ncbi:MAG: L-fucose/L-arabinose isomerase family protein [Bacteroidales bacterium]